MNCEALGQLRAKLLVKHLLSELDVWKVKDLLKILDYPRQTLSGIIKDRYTRPAITNWPYSFTEHLNFRFRPKIGSTSTSTSGLPLDRYTSTLTKATDSR